MDRLSRFFFLAQKYGTALHAPHDISTGARAVLMQILSEGESSVPILADSRGISRQAIQKTVNNLERRGLVVKFTPEHDKRNRLLRVSKMGRALMTSIQRREHLEVIRIATRVPHKDMEYANTFMDWLEGELEARTQELNGIENE